MYTLWQVIITNNYIGNTHLLTYLQHGILLEKLTDFQVIKKFPVFYGTRRVIITFTSVRHLSLS